ncbi:hypothetical protein G7046_g713 [Stylonectria norvegica]|nr:hypothetical protein G7046_g713 [Stylonectria norvegica]
MNRQIAPKARKYAPRAKSGCSTCRIRRVKCDEQKPSCKRCTDTGRNCDGYATAVGSDLASLNITKYEVPFSIPGSQQDRMLLHFYCNQSASDLSGYLGGRFWYDLVLQQGQVHSCVLQAVLAFSASHLQHLTAGHTSMMTDTPALQSVGHEKLYIKAIRSLRKYLDAKTPPDPRVVSICCALFFCFENAVGDVAAALKHLEGGLRALKTSQKQVETTGKSPTPIRPGVDLSTQKFPPTENEIVHLFSRLDCQATIYDDSRSPVLAPILLPRLPLDLKSELLLSFSSISEAQQALDTMFSHLSHFLTTNVAHKFTAANCLPDSIVAEKRMLVNLFSVWRKSFDNFTRSAGHLSEAQETWEGSWNTQQVLELQLNTIRHYILWMFLCSSFPYDSQVFAATPNPAAEEILRLCKLVAQKILAKPSSENSNGASASFWKLSSEMGILAPMFMLAIKCGDDSVRIRATQQIRQLRGYSEGLFNADVLCRFLEAAEKRANWQESEGADGEASKEDWEDLIQWPEMEAQSAAEIKSSKAKPLEERLKKIVDEPGGLAIWSERINMTK